MVLRALASRLLFPLLVLAMGSWAVIGSTLQLAPRLGLPDAANPALLLLGTVVFFYTAIGVLERWLPYRGEWNRAQGDVGTDWLHLFLTGQGANLAYQMTLAGVAVAGAAWVSARLGHGLWPERWPAAAQLVFALLVAEFGHYWFHRLSHQSDWLWRIHAVHHSAPRLYWLNATRFHPIDLFALIGFQTVPLVLLGADGRALVMYALFSAVYGQVQHCNVDLESPGPLNAILSSHELHRWHHSTDPREGNSNYGAITSLWDRLFGSYLLPPGRSFDGPVGIGALPGFPAGYLAQLAAPFRWARVRAEAARSTG